MTLVVFSILVAMTIAMLCGWFFQRVLHNGGWTDVFWTYGTGLTCSVGAMVPFEPQGSVGWRSILVASLMLLWAARLGTYVARRVAKGPEDVRYAIIRREWGEQFQLKMLGLLVVQAPITAILSVAVLFASHNRAPHVRIADILGITILIASIAGEAWADGKMARFKADPANRGRICEAGLWGWSRHPNYFFEALGWVAYPVIGTDLGRPLSLLSWLAPALMYLVVRYGTGIPPLEAAMLQSKGDAYRRYQRRVSVLVPWPPAAIGRRDGPVN